MMGADATQARPIDVSYDNPLRCLQRQSAASDDDLSSCEVQCRATELSCQRLGHLIHVRTEVLAQQAAEPRIIIKTPNHSSNGAFEQQAMECQMDCRTASNTGSIVLGENPPSAFAAESA